ncbi:hypothetical protein AiwAL_13675 [Acidiphilium sp. AL]|uniref:DUF4412 domain-containing protein n=1 Tax=Acidiphilium iwatense TaxID=768198 RepID=A0ABS9DT23_9PROT|nr:MULTISPECIES: hypothetical protein [Acidiphilium]MCF3945842.1 hypothetical protein [Acidiphilium iwatense]MCU4161143.1 hypothetical protein [Acidiphilium sp. AL]
MTIHNTAALAAFLLAMGVAHAAAAPRLIPDHDAMGVYRISQPGKPTQTWRVRYLAASERVRAVSLSGQAAGTAILLDLASGAANVVLPQMHAVVAVPGLSAMMQKVMDNRGAHFTRLGQATIAGRACTRYLVLKPKGDGSACITPGGVVLQATGKNDHGSVAVQALSITNAPQQAAAFTPPAGYSSITLPPQMLAQLLGG